MKRALGILVVLLSGCGPSPSRRAPDITRVEILARDFEFLAPDSVPAGLIQLTFHNQGPSYHHLQIVRLNAEVPFAAARDSLPTAEPLPKWMVPVGGIEGADSLHRTVTVSTRLTPGRYLLICRITTPERRTHYSLGMVRPLVVTGSSELQVADPAGVARP